MLEFKEPELEIVRFVNDVITSSDCNCDLGEGPEGDDEICTGGTGEGGDIECVIQGPQGNC